jgi:hypothetical protein
MKSAEIRTPATAPVDTTVPMADDQQRNQKRNGPTLIDPELFGLISGGIGEVPDPSPRGGW